MIAIYAKDMKKYTAVSDGISALIALIIVNIPPCIVKSLEDPEQVSKSLMPLILHLALSMLQILKKHK